MQLNPQLILSYLPNLSGSLDPWLQQGHARGVHGEWIQAWSGECGYNLSLSIAQQSPRHVFLQTYFHSSFQALFLEGEVHTPYASLYWVVCVGSWALKEGMH